jgi:hypothetical protein
MQLFNTFQKKNHCIFRIKNAFRQLFQLFYGWILFHSRFLFVSASKYRFFIQFFVSLSPIGFCVTRLNLAWGWLDWAIFCFKMPKYRPKYCLRYQMCSRKSRPKGRHFVKMNPLLVPRKNYVALKILGSFCNFQKKTARINSCPRGENSPNLGPMLWFFKYFRRIIKQKIGVFYSKQS